jgi:hypothetical protein
MKNIQFETTEMQEIRDTETKGEVEITFFTSENNLRNCPHIDVQVANEKVVATVDSGSEICIITEDLYDHLVLQGLEAMEIGISNTRLVTAFGGRSRLIRKQVFIPLSLGDTETLEAMFLASPQLCIDTHAYWRRYFGRIWCSN